MNLEEKLCLRKENFMRSSQNTLEERSNYAISLRKKKRIENIQNKRKQIKYQNDTKMFDPSIANPIIRQISLILDSLISKDQLEQSLIEIKTLCASFNLSYLLEYPEIIKRLNLFTHKEYSDGESSIVMNLWAKVFAESTSVCKKGVSLIPISTILLAMDTSKPKTTQRAYLCLGNLAGDSKDFRLQLISENALSYSLPVLMNTNNINVLRAASFFYVHMSKEQRSINIKTFDDMISGLRQQIFFDDEETLSQSLFAIHSVIEEDEKKIERFMHFGMIERLYTLAEIKTNSVSYAALKIIGDIAFANILQINILIEKGLFDLLVKTINLSSPNIRKESMYIICNLVASGTPVLDEIVQHYLIEKIILSLQEREKPVLKECSYVYRNIAKIGNWSHFKVFLELGVLIHLKDNLKRSEVDVSKNFLIFAEKLLFFATQNQAFYVFDDFSLTGCQESVESLQKHMNPAIYQKVTEILKYFVSNEELSCEEDHLIDFNPDFHINFNI